MTPVLSVFAKDAKISLPELKTEEGCSADIVRTYIPGDICPHNVGTMSALCPHYLPRKEGKLIENIDFIFYLHQTL